VIRSSTSQRPGPWRWLQGQSEPDFEIPGVKSIEIDRSLGDDCATCRIVVYNDLALADGSPEGVDNLGRPGYLSYSRGETLASPRHSVYDTYKVPAGGIFQDTSDENTYRTTWLYPKGFWFDKLIPNRLLRTYQGYGSDNHDLDGNDRAPDDPLYIVPWDDKHLVITGTWLVDTVTFGTDGLVTITCRDVGKLLLEQVVYPPMIPLARFPLKYCPDEAAVYRAATGAAASLSADRIHYPLVHDGAAHEQHTDTYPGGYVYGHHARHAFDDDPATYYLSHSYSSSTGAYEEEWIQGECNSATINQLRVRTYGTGYVCYVSVLEAGDWQGGSVIPYSAAGESHSHGAGIPYVVKHTFGSESQIINLPRPTRPRSSGSRSPTCATSTWTRCPTGSPCAPSPRTTTLPRPTSRRPPRPAPSVSRATSTTGPRSSPSCSAGQDSPGASTSTRSANRPSPPPRLPPTR